MMHSNYIPRFVESIESETSAVPTTFTWWTGKSSGLMDKIVAEVKINWVYI